MMSDIQIDAEQERRRMTAKIIQLAGTTYKVTRSAIHAFRVLAAVLAAKRKECEAAQAFSKQFGSHTGFLEIKTEDEKVLRHFEQRMKTDGVEYARLPTLQHGLGATQYMYNLDKLDNLNNVIHTYEADRIASLDDLKRKYGTGEKYQNAKQALTQEMPEIGIITIDDYAKSAISPDGTETEEFKIINEAAKEAEKATGKGLLADDKALASLLKDLDKSSKIADGSLKPVTVPEVRFDTLVRAGKKIDVAVVPLKSQNLTLVLPKSTALSSGKVLIDPSKTYQVIQNVTKKLIPIPGARVISIIKDVINKVKEVVQEQAQSVLQQENLPQKTRRRSR